MERLLSNGVAIDTGTPGRGCSMRRSTGRSPLRAVKTMRASILALGTLIARCGEARVRGRPCMRIGFGAVDQHVKGLEAMARRSIRSRLHQRGGRPLRVSVRIRSSSPSPHREPDMAARSATARRARKGAAREPEIRRPRRLHGAMGARTAVRGRRISRRVVNLRRTHRIMQDRIETGSLRR